MENLISPEKFAVLEEWKGLDWTSVDHFQPDVSEYWNLVALYNIAANEMNNAPVDLPKGKLLLQHTTNALPEKIALYDGERPTVDGTFAHFIVAAIPKEKWDTSFFPPTLKKSVKSTSALTALTGKESAVYVDKTTKTGVAFTLAPLTEATKAATCLMPELCPWLASKPAAGSEGIKLLQAVKANKNADIKRIVNAQLQRFEDWIKPRQMEKDFADIGERAATELVDKYRNQLDSSQGRIRDWRKAIADEIAKMNEVSRIYEALSSGDGASENISELKDFFKACRYLKYGKANGNMIFFTIRQPLVAYNTLEFETRYKNKASNVYKRGDKIANFLYGVIMKQRFDIWCEADMILNVSGSLECDCSCYDETVLQRTETALPHPHMVHHHCIGSGNANDIEDFMEQGKYVAAVEQAISAASGVNIHESATWEPFIDLLHRQWSKTCCVSADGETFYTPEQAYKIMVEEGVIEDGEAD